MLCVLNRFFYFNKMRTKVVLLCLCAGAVGLAAVFWAKHQSPKPPVEVPVAVPVAKSVSDSGTTNEPTNVMAAQGQVAIEPAPEAVAPPIATNSAAVEAANAGDQRAVAIQEKVLKLQDWQANDDAQSLKNILAELTNPEKEVRAAAIEAAIQFGSRDAIPVLKAAAGKTTDPAEKKALLDAAEFIALPSMTEANDLNQPPPQPPQAELPPQ
jgi:hypothetical protein